MHLVTTIALLVLFIGEARVVWANKPQLCITDGDCNLPGTLCNFRGRCVTNSDNIIPKPAEMPAKPTESSLPVYDPTVKTAEQKAAPLDHRCTTDNDCTLPGTLCDSALGLCNLSPKVKLTKPTVSPLTCFTQSSPRMSMIKEKCDGVHDTGSHVSQAERNKIFDFVNEFRAMINNNCTLGLGIPKPASNYRKVKYNCMLESKSKFECSRDIKPETFASDEKTWRSFGSKQDPNYRQVIFQRLSPLANQLQIDTNTSMVENDDDKAVFIKLFMSEDVTEVGCFVKVCGEYEYIACKTNHDPNVPNDAPLYTPGQRCNVDSDCTLPGWSTCDASVGLCDYKSQVDRAVESMSSKCDNVRNVYIDLVPENCNPGGYYTGSEMSNKEREIIVQTVNDYRSRVNNECDLGKGAVKPVTNYHKIKYSCGLESAARWDMGYIVKPGNPSTFKSTRHTLRYVRLVSNGNRTTIFIDGVPRNEDMRIDPVNQTVDASDAIRSYLHFMLSPDVTEIGCFVNTTDGYEYMACKTDHVVLPPKERPLYAPGNRCVIDEDCTLPGYKQCDVVSGLCDITPRVRQISVKKNNASKCEDIPQVYVERVTEKCSPHYDTGSDMGTKEREAIVNVANQFRALINNNCNLGLGNVKPTKNYVKLKYSCRLEEDAKFECDDPSLATFKTNSPIWRRKAELGTNFTRPLFFTGTPRNQDLLIEPYDKMIKSSIEMKHFIRLIMSTRASNIGCFTKVCNGTEYYACRSGPYLNSNYIGSFYSSSDKRCNADSDCTFDGYRFCDSESGLCETS